MFILTLAIFIVSFCNSSAKRLSFSSYPNPLSLPFLILISPRCSFVAAFSPGFVLDSSSCLNDSLFLISISFFILVVCCYCNYPVRLQWL
uniref:Secreted protein n=1 Tax=Anopheles darlingi TaxID=43151 RepID=A0A2M4D0Z0_ANODA